MKRIVNRVPLNEQKEVTEKAHLLHLIRSSEPDSTPPKRLAQEDVVAWHHSDATMMSLEHLAEEDVVGLRAKDGPRLARAFVAVAAFGNRVSVTHHLSAMHARKAGGRAGHNTSPARFGGVRRRRVRSAASFCERARGASLSSRLSRLVSSRLVSLASVRFVPQLLPTPDAPRRRASATS